MPPELRTFIPRKSSSLRRMRCKPRRFRRRSMESIAYYLIHSMSGRVEGFESRDRQAAHNFAVAAKQCRVQRVIYLGGLAATGFTVSAHLKSRHETGAVLRKFGPLLLELRAGIIVGNGSTSFEIIRCLTERLPVMICPRWVVKI